jgi:hypothetical protein
MERMGGVHEEDDIVMAFVFLELFVLIDKGFLEGALGLAGNEFGLLIDVA